MDRYRVHLTNFGYFSERQFKTFDDALDWAISVCFETSIWKGETIVARWSPISGLGRYNY